MAITVHRIIRRDRKYALLGLEMPVRTLHEIEMHARVAGMSLAAYAEAVLLAGPRDCEHGVSVLAVGAAACTRCIVERREVAEEVLRSTGRR